MQKHYNTPILVSMFLSDPTPTCLTQLAGVAGIKPANLKARFYRAGVFATPKTAMFYSDEEIAKAYQDLRSRRRVVEKLGIDFYTVTAALNRKGIEYKTQGRPPRLNTKVQTFYYWKCRSHEPVLRDVEFIVGSKSPGGNHIGTIRAVTLKEAVQKAPGRAITRKQWDSFNRASKVNVANKVLLEMLPSTK